MLTFNQAGKDDLIMKLERHAKADAFKQGIYFADGKGCAVGCTLVDYGVSPEDHSQYEKLFGIPEVVARLEDCIFEGLPLDKAKEWPLRFANAVPVNADLSGVWPKFAIALMVDPEHGVINYAKTEAQKSVIKRCANLYANHPNVDKDEARIIRKDAYSAYAYAAAYAAAGAAADAADAAYAARKTHYQWMADKLIELLESTK